MTRPAHPPRRRPPALAIGGAALLAALGIAAAAPDGAHAAAKNRLNAYTWVKSGCGNPGFGLTTTSPEGFLLGYGSLGGACSISGPWGVPINHGAQGRLTYTPPAGAHIAQWRNLHLEVHGAGSPPVSSEVYAADPGGEYQLYNWSSSPIDGQVHVTPRHADGAYRMFFLMRNHSHHTQSAGSFRHANIHGGTIDLFDLERPKLSGVSVDGGSAWSASASRVVRWTGSDNLSSAGIERYTIRAGSSVLYDSSTGAGTPGAKAKSVNIGGLPDGTHSLTVTAESAGSGNLGDTAASGKTVRIDRTAPALSSQLALPSSVTGQLTLRLAATDAYSGIKNVTIERAVPGGWKAVHTAGGSYGSIGVDSLALGDGSRQLRAVARDNVGNTRTLGLGTVSVENSPRRADSSSFVTFPSTIRPGSRLTAAPGAWSGLQPISFSYQWQRGSGSSWQAIPGATAASFSVTAAEVGKRLRLVLTADNAAAGSVTETSFASEPVQSSAASAPLPPVVRAPTRTPNPARDPRPERAVVVPPVPSGGPQPGEGAHLVLDSPAELMQLNSKKPRLTLRAKRAVPLFVVRYPKPSAISIGGRFLQADGTPISGHPIALVEAGVVRDWARTDPQGRVSFRYRALRSGGLRLRWAGDEKRDPILATAAVKVIGRLGVKVPRAARGGRFLTVRGRAVPGVRAQLVVLERLNTSRCRAWRRVTVNGRVLSAGTRAPRAAPGRCWEVAGKARTARRGVFRVRDRTTPLRLAGGGRPGSYAYAAYVRVRAVNTISRPVRVMVRG